MSGLALAAWPFASVAVIEGQRCASHCSPSGPALPASRVTWSPCAQVRRVHESRHPHRPLPMSDAKLAEVIRSAAASAILSMQREASTSFCAPNPLP